MTENRKGGCHLVESLPNLHYFLEFFESYVQGRVRGFCLFWQTGDSPVGVTMVGTTNFPDRWETDLGDIANLWGVYVDPPARGQGITMKLFARALEMGREMGFDTAETYVRPENEHGQRLTKAFGTRCYSEQHFVRLNDPRIMQNEEAKKCLAREITHG